MVSGREGRGGGTTVGTAPRSWFAQFSGQTTLRLSRRGCNAGPRVGDGVPGVKEAFEEVYDAAGGASFLGLPSADAYEFGPGVVQHLRGACCGHPAVICAVSGWSAVVITADLWNGIAQVGAGRRGARRRLPGPYGRRRSVLRRPCSRSGADRADPGAEAASAENLIRAAQRVYGGLMGVLSDGRS
ncbi:hypothetical protein GCM10009827_109560 [Dactylosporangium maewongense]|uniref:Uncharacterized protein n=1 Tax=Dactylosporangium maewongense TaxID=634393 RepID=A0ABP4P347_9ACTN